jgi:hypothetical protein
METSEHLIKLIQLLATLNITNEIVNYNKIKEIFQRDYLLIKRLQLINLDMMKDILKEYEMMYKHYNKNDVTKLAEISKYQFLAVKDLINDYVRIY